MNFVFDIIITLISLVFLGIVVGLLFAVCTGLLMIYQLNKRTTIQMADELAERRRKLAATA